MLTGKLKDLICRTLSHNGSNYISKHQSDMYICNIQLILGSTGFVDPEIILKLIFLLFLDNVKSERELMRIVPERFDYLWFLGYGWMGV